MSNLNLILLAGGNSSRFAPLKEKNLYKFLGKSVIEYQIGKYKEFLDFNQVIVITNDTNYDVISVQSGEGITVLKQIGDGMAGAANTALEKLSDEDDVLMVNMNDFFEDHLFEQFESVLGDLRSNNRCLLTGYKTEKYFPGGYLVLDDNNFIKEVQEKPGEGNEPSEYVRFVFDYFVNIGQLKKYMADAKSESDDVYEVALTDMMNAGIEFQMLDYAGKWVTVKYPWHILDVMEFFLSKIDKQQIADDARIADTAVINGNVIIESGCKIFDGAVINGPAYLGKNCIVGNNALVRDSMLGDGCVVGYSTEAARTYWGDQVWTHKNYIGDSIIEGNVSFGSNSVTANLRLDEQNITINVKGEKVDAGTNKLGNIIASNVRIGVGVMLMPGIKIGEGTFVGSGLVLDQDVEEGKYIYKKEELMIKENRFDITATSRADLKENINK